MAKMTEAEKARIREIWGGIISQQDTPAPGPRPRPDGPRPRPRDWPPPPPQTAPG